MVLFLPSPSGIATGEADSVGVRYVPATERNPPLRVFYPAASTGNGKEVGFFQDTSAALFLQGFWGVMMGRRRDTLLYKLGMILAKLVAWFLPFTYSKLPGVYQDASASSSTPKLPLILFSHGDMCTGQENSVLLSAWARQGYVVVSVHHTDGSSNHAKLEDGSILWYETGPPLNDYDANFRPTKIKKRVENMLQARDWLVSAQLPGIDAKVDWEKTIVAGFSYGGATAALLTANNVLPSLSALILLDGWFYVNICQSNVEFEFPREAFVEAPYTKEIPALVLVSETNQQMIPKNWAATQKLASQLDADPPFIVPNTTHMNFCDLIFWFPPFVMSMVGWPINSADPKKAYANIVNLTVNFLKKQQCFQGNQQGDTDTAQFKFSAAQELAEPLL